MNVYFKCRVNGEHTFSLVKPEEIEGNWDWLGKVHCPYCGTPDIQLDPTMLPGGAIKRDLGQLRRENREMTRQAQSMAMQAQTNESVNNPEITLNPIQGAKSNEPLKIKKNILDSIESKRPDGYA